MKHLAEKLIELRKMATGRSWTRKNVHINYDDSGTIATCYVPVRWSSKPDGHGVCPDMYAMAGHDQKNAEFIVFAANHAADIAERMLRLEKALELALYYVEGDSTYEAVKMKVEAILRGES